MCGKKPCSPCERRKKRQARRGNCRLGLACDIVSWHSGNLETLAHRSASGAAAAGSVFGELAGLPWVKNLTLATNNLGYQAGRGVANAQRAAVGLPPMPSRPLQPPSVKKGLDSLQQLGLPPLGKLR